MRKLDWRLVPGEGTGLLLLMTIHEVELNAPLSVSDFRDDYALSFKPTGLFVGLSESRGLRLGLGPMLVDGIWRIREETKISVAYQDVKLSPEVLSLKRIR